MTQPPSVFQPRGNRKEAGGVLVKIIMILAGLAIVIPLLLDYGMSPPSQAGIDVSNIVNGQESYFATVGGGSYAASLSDLQQADMIEVQLGAGTKAGYVFTMTVGADGKTFTITARPQQYGQTETRSFFASQTGVVRYTDENRSAGPDDSPM